MLMGGKARVSSLPRLPFGDSRGLATLPSLVFCVSAGASSPGAAAKGSCGEDSAGGEMHSSPHLRNSPGLAPATQGLQTVLLVAAAAEVDSLGLVLHVNCQDSQPMAAQQRGAAGGRKHLTPATFPQSAYITPSCQGLPQATGTAVPQPLNGLARGHVCVGPQARIASISPILRSGPDATDSGKATEYPGDPPSSLQSEQLSWALWVHLHKHTLTFQKGKADPSHQQGQKAQHWSVALWHPRLPILMICVFIYLFFPGGKAWKFSSEYFSACRLNVARTPTTSSPSTALIFQEGF